MNQVTFSFSQLSKIYMIESRMEFLKTIRTPAFAIPSLLFPIMFYAFFGLVFNRGGMGGQAPTYLLATYGVFGVMGPALFSFGVGVASEKQQGWLALKQVSPMPISAYLIAKVLGSMLFGIIILLQLFVIGALFGDVEMSRFQWIATFLVTLVGSLPFCALGLYLGLKFSGQAAPAVVNLIYLPMSFLSGLWVPIQMFPDVMQSIAFALPSFHLAQLVLKIQGNDLGYAWSMHAASLLIMSLALFWLAARVFNKVSQPG